MQKFFQKSKFWILEKVKTLLKDVFGLDRNFIKLMLQNGTEV